MTSTRVALRALAVVAGTTAVNACAVTVGAQAPAPVAVQEVTVAEEEVRIPPGHMPAPGECRIWIPGDPPGKQPPAGDCQSLERHVPSGAWLLLRPDQARRVVRIR